MKSFTELFKSPVSIIRIAVVFLAFAAAFYLAKHFFDDSQQLFFFTHRPNVRDGGGAAVSPNANISAQRFPLPPPPVAIPSPPPPSPPPPYPARFGVVDQNGEMKENFDVGRLDPDSREILDLGNETEVGSGAGEGMVRVRVRVDNKFQRCPARMSEYIPCLDNLEAIEKLSSSEKGEMFERHCPEEGKGLDCLVTAPENYQTPIPWPKSRDEVWFSNVPHTRLVEDKGGQNWITRDKEKFKFPGGGTQFIHGADQYLNQISEMVQDIAFGSHTRVVLDVGCGIASFGAYLFSKDVITMSIAPKDVHENQIQFALERGVPAMLAAFATHKLLYPSQAFDLIHCSRCRINWTRDVFSIVMKMASCFLRSTEC